MHGTNKWCHKRSGRLFVSGLVEWSSDKIYNELARQGYSLMKKTKTNEWVTMVLQKEN